MTDDVEHLRSTAQQLERDHQSGAAIVAWSVVAEVDSSDFEAHERLSQLLYEGGGPAEALVHLQVVTQLRPEWVKGWTRLARALDELREPARSAAAWARVSALAPTEVEAHDRLSQLLHGLGRSSEAVVHFRAVAELSPDWMKGWVRLARVLDELREPQSAAEAWARVAALAPADVEAHDRLSQLLYGLGRHSEAVVHFRAVAELTPEWVKGWVRLARALDTAQDPAGAADAWSRVAHLSPDHDEARDRLSLLLAELGHKKDALAHAWVLTRLRPGSSKGWMRAADYCNQLGDAEGMVAAWRGLLPIRKTESLAHKRLARLLSDAGAHVEAAAHLRSLARLSPGRPPVWHRLAQELEKAGDARGAAEAWSRLRALSPALAEAYPRLEKLLARLSHDDARLRVSRLAQASPTRALTWASIAQVLEHTGDVQGAIEAWQGLLAVQPGAFQAHKQLSRLFFDGGRRPEAIPHLRALADRSPRQGKLWTRLALCLREEGDLAGEASALIRAVAVRGEGAEGHQRLALLMARLGREQEAVVHLRATCKTGARFSDVWKSFVLSLRDAEGFEAAARIQQRIVAIKDNRGASIIERNLYGPPVTRQKAVSRLGARRPKVGIGLPVYNDERYIGEAIASLLAQDYREFELVIVDNCSTDRTVEIIKDWARRDGRIRLIQNPTNLGSIRNFNLAFRFSAGEYFMWASSHDLWDPRLISRLAQALDERPEAVVAYSHVRQIDEAGRPFGYQTPSFNTAGLPARERLRVAVQRMSGAGVMSLGLHRRAALARTPGSRPCLMPDRLLMIEYSVEGEFVEVPVPLWSRRYDLARPKSTWAGAVEAQQKALFPEGSRRRPLAELVVFSHCAWLAYDLGPRRLLRDPLSIWWGVYAAVLYWKRFRQEAAINWPKLLKGLDPWRAVVERRRRC